MTDREKLREQLKQMDWYAGYSNKSGYRAQQAMIGRQVTKLKQATACPFERDMLRAYSHEWIYEPGTKPETLSARVLTPYQYTYMDLWFSGGDE
jgi:hypothetical protein